MKINCIACNKKIIYADLDRPCPNCYYVNATRIVDNEGPDDWTSTRDDPVTDEMLNFLDSSCENQRIMSEKYGSKHGFYPYPYLELKRLIYEIRALREHKLQSNNDSL